MDKYRMLPETKGRSKLYLELLRHLGVTNKQIAKIVKETMLRTIALHHINTYRAIKKSRHPVLRQDPELRHAMKQFEARLARERKKQKEEKAVKYASYLRSYGNLKGHWQTTADSNERISFVFSSKTHLRVTQTRNNRSSIFEGAWTSDQKHIIFNIAKTINQSENGTTHSRTTSVRLYYVINSIDRQNITLLDTRRNKKIELHRKRR
ncbi:MAG TPA: hypothetical protein ENL04_04335 [Sulfuricurvum sp.]|nr:hypothetical protein [Sulfuricurvum sp.]